MDMRDAVDSTLLQCNRPKRNIVRERNLFAIFSSNVRGQRTERYHLHANLALGMLLGQVTFLAGSGHPPGTVSNRN